MEQQSVGEFEQDTLTSAINGGQYLASGRITGMLGVGGMAVVYEIFNESLGVKRAVKVLKPNCLDEHRERFDTEIKVMAQLDHANVIRIHSVGLWNNLPYIEMEKVDGWSLAQIIERHGALPLEAALAVALIVSRALNYTHHHEYFMDGVPQVGILHRDLKPANILISRKGVVRLTDFGIATPVRVSKHTPDGSVVGSLQYIAPEQLSEKEIDCRADIFSFGCVLYELLCGFKVFPDRDISRLVQSRLANTFDHIDSFTLTIPARLRKLIKSCLEFDPVKRPDSMTSVAKELGAIYSALTHIAPEATLKQFVENAGNHVTIVSMKKKNRWWPLSAIAAAAMISLTAVTPARKVIYPVMVDVFEKVLLRGSNREHDSNSSDQKKLGPKQASQPRRQLAAAPVDDDNFSSADQVKMK